MTSQTHDSTQRLDVYSRITDRIVSDLENGTAPWVKPWSSGNGDGLVARPVRNNGEPYRGINVLTLWCDALEKGFSSSMWMTFKQAQEQGAHVRKGEKASLVVYADRFTKTETDERGQDAEREIPFLKGYSVFNVEQIEGLPEHLRAARQLPKPVHPQITMAEAFFAATGAHILHGGSHAYYSATHDFIQLPSHELFTDAQSYAATKAHEMVHWTGNPQRLAREFGKRFGDHAYAVEELVAEIGAAFLCADLGVSLEPRADHAAYLASWLEVLKTDKRAIFTAAAQAQRAADFLHGLQPPQAGNTPHPLPVGEQALLVRDARGGYEAASADQVLAAARSVVDRNVSTFSDSADEFFYVMTVGSVSSVDVVLAVKAPGRCSRLAAVSVLSPSRGLIATEAGGRLAFGGPLM